MVSRAALPKILTSRCAIRYHHNSTRIASPSQSRSHPDTYTETQMILIFFVKMLWHGILGCCDEVVSEAFTLEK
jgi:hypothetical protein